MLESFKSLWIMSKIFRISSELVLCSDSQPLSSHCLKVTLTSYNEGFFTINKFINKMITFGMSLNEFILFKDYRVYFSSNNILFRSDRTDHFFETNWSNYSQINITFSLSSTATQRTEDKSNIYILFYWF